MLEVKIGKSNVITNKLGLGTNKVGGHNLFKNLDEKEGELLLRAALDSGITMLDTAYMYGLGRSEEIIGKVLKDYDRKKVILATKAAQDPSNDYKPNNDPAFLIKAVDEALERLQTDYIDVFYIHFPDALTDKAKAVAALNQLKEVGKIRAIGVSNFSLEQLKQANKNGQVDVVEDHYSLVHREAEKERFAYLREQSISFVPYFPLASGLLTGKYTLADRSKFKQFSELQFEKIMTGLQKVRTLSEKYQATVLEMVLAWYMKNPDIAVVIPGARNANQVSGIAGTFDVKLTNEDYQMIDQAFKSFIE